jgi:hypothetical protein
MLYSSMLLLPFSATSSKGTNSGSTRRIKELAASNHFDHYNASAARLTSTTCRSVPGGPYAIEKSSADLAARLSPGTHTGTPDAIQVVLKVRSPSENIPLKMRSPSEAILLLTVVKLVENCVDPVYATFCVSCAAEARLSLLHDLHVFSHTLQDSLKAASLRKSAHFLPPHF